MIEWYSILVFIYLRIGASWLTIKSIDEQIAIEGNPFMQDIENKDKRFWFFVNLFTQMFFISLVFLFAFNPIMIFLILFISWIDFHHDWEIYYQGKGFKRYLKKQSNAI